jgi:hypothetical protein
MLGSNVKGLIGEFSDDCINRWLPYANLATAVQKLREALTLGCKRRWLAR